MRIFEILILPGLSGRSRGPAVSATSACFMVRGCNTGCQLFEANAGCTKHICGVGQDAVASVSTAARVRHGVVLGPRRALEIQPYRGVGQVPDSKRRAHPVAADVSPCRTQGA